MAEAVLPAPEELDEASIGAMFDLSKKKKKKSKKTEDSSAAGDETTLSSEGAAAGDAPSSGSTSALSVAPASEAGASHPSLGLEGDEELSYDALLGRIYKLLYANNPELTDRTRKKLKPPQVMRVGTTRTAWVNFKEICTMMKRSTEHVQLFFLNELGTTGSVDGADRMLIKGKYQPKYIESLLRKYIQEYVTCHMCKSLETDLTRDPVSRLYFMSCKACNSDRSVAPIKAGFHATSKGERKKARELEN